MKKKLKQRNLVFDLHMWALNYNWYEVMGDMQLVQVASWIATQLCKVSIKSFG